MNKQFSSIIYFYGKHKDNLKFIPIIGLIFLFGIVFIMGSKEIIFLTKFNNALTIFFNYLSELFDISDTLVLVRNIIIIITIGTGYVFWLKRIEIVRTNSWLVKIVLCLLTFLFITEHIANSPIEQFVDLTIYLAFIFLILAVLFFSSKEIYLIDLSSLVSETEPISKDPLSFNYRSGASLTDPELDRFKRYPFAQRVAETIALHREPDSIVIRIYGEWGAGKSTILSFIERELQKRDDVIFVKFNPWLFKDDIHLLQNFFQTIANKLGRSISSSNEKIGEWLKDYSAYLSFTIGGIVQLSPGEVGKIISPINIDKLRNRIEKVLRDEGKRIVILIDDIDRLDKSEIQMIFKLVKLSADFDNTTYVLAFDEEMVSEALGDKYSSGEMNNLGNKEAGKSFIEKIVQVPLHLPKADIISLRNICIGYAIDALGQAKIDISDEQCDKFTNSFIRCIEPRLQTPRMAIRYGNVLLFSLSLLKDETNPIDLMLIEGMRLFYPKLYDIVRENPDMFLGSRNFVPSDENIKKHKKELLGKAFEGLDNNGEESAKNLLMELFPFFDMSSLQLPFSSDLNDKLIAEQRVGSRQYFERYFSYAVLEGDIPDTILDNFIDSIEHHAITDVQAELKILIEGRSVDLFVLKLSKKAKKLSQKASYNLAIAIAIANDDDFLLRPVSMGRFSTEFSQVLYLVVQLLKIVPEDNRFSAFEVIIREGLILFALRFFYRIGAAEELIEGDVIFTVEKINRLGTILKERIKQLSETNNICTQYPDYATSFFDIWSIYGSRTETNQYITKTFDDNPQNALELLKSYTKTWYSASQSRKGDFEKADYDSITKVVDANVIYDVLNKTYGLNMEKLKDENRFKSDVDKIAHQFVQIHASHVYVV